MCTSNSISICCFAAPVPFHLPLGGWFGAGESPAATPSLCLEIPDAEVGKIHGKMLGRSRDFMGKVIIFPIIL